MKVKTIKSAQVWQSPDGQKTIWAVTLQAEGKNYELKTYSQKIATEGFEGDVESYANPRGDRFVRQVPEVLGRPRGFTRDEDGIRAQWAIGQAINLASVTMDREEITINVVEKFAKDLYVTVGRVKDEKPNAARPGAAGTLATR